ncbi:kinesin-related protein 1-like isoform X2 [Anneissia japonica]|uniref:kinesin-related protein 1-like isoform X2 n=1 Tax=Anneissia japonica TaxID=1529436 RepID=UPI001425737C|nr:kinesin-related protein 1-like isoform X2 [Anneissia japonica]
MLSRVLEQLVDIYGAIREKKAIESAVIKDCKTLLKPWPRNKKKIKKVQDDTQEVVKDQEKGKGKEDMEALILSEVELMLAKAQNARDVLAKTDQGNEQKTKGITARKQESKTLRKEQGINNERVETHSEEQYRKETSQSGSQLLQLPNTSTKSAVPNKKIKGAATGLSNKDSSIKILETELKHLNSKLSKVKISSSFSNHYSTSSSEIGKYSKRPSSEVTSSCSRKSLLSKSGNERRRVSAANTSKQRRADEKIRTGTTNTNKRLTIRGNKTAHNAQVLARKIMKSAPSRFQVGNEESSRCKSAGADDVKKKSCKPSKGFSSSLGNATVKNESDSQDDELLDVDEEGDEPPFLLKTDGTKLSFPLHFQRLYNTQEVLINKVSEVFSGSKPTTACQHFLERVNSKLLGRTEASFSLYEHDMRYQKLKQEYEQLISTADQQLLAFHQVSLDKSSWQDLYQIKMYMELIYNRSQQLLTEIQDFEKNIIEDIYPQRLSPVKIEYSNLHELQRLVVLQLEVQALEVEHQIQKLLSEEMLPILAAMDKEDPGFMQCYRSLYGLLCYSGEHFPTIIVDVDD